MWLWLVEGEPPTKTDMFGAGLAIIGALVIIAEGPLGWRACSAPIASALLERLH
jgi:drug/metabolite transporter superfamily protein YnfA